MARKVRHVRDVRRLAAYALQQGGLMVRPGVMAWDVSGGCQDPYPITIEGKQAEWVYHDPFGDWRPVPPHAENLRIASDYPGFWIDIDTPCRKCEVCLKRRAARWAYRAKNEIAAAPRTWFGTLTADPHWHTVFKYRAALAAEAKSVDLFAEGSDEMFRAVSREFGREVTKWLKRVRKESGVTLRYILVVEAHKSGLPHMHILVHECDTGSPVRWRTLHDQWKCGFSSFKLVEDSGSAWYVCKYLSKAALARVRASKLYGNNTLSEHRLNRIQ